LERQLTHAGHGHILTNYGVWSPDGQWIVYDIRSDAAGSNFDGTRIERVHVETGEVQVLYESRRGACCGVVTCSPVNDRVAFILGPEDPTPDWQYAPFHRRGVIVDASRPGVAVNLDARDLTPPYTPGALRGGTHVHVFGGDGQWISFTYEDHVLATLEPALAATADRNQRNVGVSTPAGPVAVPRTHPRNHDGAMFTVLVTETQNYPRRGSDEIYRAYEDAWVGTNGYVRPDGSRQKRALAFLADLIDRGDPISELFIVDLPDNVTQAGDRPLAGTPTTRPAPPAGVVQRRLTHTIDRRYPGVQGPRHWPRSSPDGSRIAVLMRDDAGVVQLWTVSPLGDEQSPVQITHGEYGVESAFTWNVAGTEIAYIADGSVCVVDVATGRSRRLTARLTGDDAPRPEACVFSPDGLRIAFVRRVETGGDRFNQIFVVEAIQPA
jgi:hypothetical protein